MTLQETIIDQLGVKPNIDPKEEIRKSVDFLKAYMLKHPFLKSYVLGISGGQDSTLAGRLAQLAVEELRAETGKDYQFIAIRLPYGVQADEDDAQRALAFIKPDVSLAVNIKEAVDGQVAELAKAGVNVSDFNKGNIKARQRMITQYAVAGENSGAIIVSCKVIFSPFTLTSHGLSYAYYQSRSSCDPRHLWPSQLDNLGG